MDSFQGQKAIVTGATRGIGKAIAEKFLKSGIYVIGLYSGNRQAAETFAEQFREYQSQFELAQCDIANQADVATFFADIEQRHDSIQILVNNAGIRKDGLVALMSEEAWQRVLDVNLTGTFLMAKQAVLLMLKNRYGRIINITSPVGYMGFAGQANYAASKAGQIAFSKSLAKEVARKKITVNCVAPGFIQTDLLDDLGEDTIAAYKKMVPMRRFGTTEEIAAGVLFLADPKASYITGTVLEITGGL